MTALIAYGPIVFLALLALVAWVRDRFRSTPSVAERALLERALDSGDALDLAVALGVVPVSALDGSHDNLDDVDQFRWVEEVMWLTDLYEADEVPIIPGRLPGEAS